MKDPDELNIIDYLDTNLMDEYYKIAPYLNGIRDKLNPLNKDCVCFTCCSITVSPKGAKLRGEYLDKNGTKENN